MSSWLELMIELANYTTSSIHTMSTLFRNPCQLMQTDKVLAIICSCCIAMWFGARALVPLLYEIILLARWNRKGNMENPL